MNNEKIIKTVKQIIDNLILIKGGTFLMGSPLEDEDAYENEYPQHLVYVQSFLMSKFVVTQQQWKAISYLSKVDRELQSYTLYNKGYNLPVVDINWYESLEFCNRLSIFTGLNITLPSEAQWEYACRAGTTTRYYCGDNLNPKLANYNKYENFKRLFQRQITPIDSYPPNPWGLYDMYGNVWEWCLDNYHSNYEGASNDDNPWVEDFNTKKVVRGGMWANKKKNCRSAFRCYKYSTSNSPAQSLRIICYKN